MSPRAGASGPLRVLLLFLVASGPFLAGAVHEPVFVPLLVGWAAAGIVAHVRARRTHRGVEPLPGRRLLAGLHALVLLQLVPLPPAVLRLASPGSFAFYETQSLGPFVAWRTISVSPPDTLRGLAFVVALTLLYLAVFRELAESPWRRRLLATVVGVGVAITVVALLQAVSPEPRKIYGLWRPRWDWGVFGPYVNRNHFAGYLVMAAPVSIGFALEAISRLRAEWSRRRRAWLLLGDREGTAVVRSSAAVMVLVAGLLAAGSRGAVAAFAGASLVLLLASRRRGATALAMALLAGLGIAWIGFSGLLTAFASRGIRASRLELWRDMLPMVPRFPVFGVGWNAFATAYPWYRTIPGPDWIGEAHDELLQALVDGGLVGAALALCLLAVVLRGALARARSSPLDLGLLGALVGLALNALVDFSFQIPANAATWTALAALATRHPREPHHRIRRSIEAGEGDP
ncbi:MAG TPA: O-antigen ligase family protein [Vicinamibacteria bacterium]|nr:O-antigen ligase family protein [Vicinamibacteria bacterium]